jgi:hypothetical protein
MARTPWWQARTYPSFGDHFSFTVNWYRTVAVQAAFEGGPPCLLGRRNGVLTKGHDEAVKELVEALGVRVVLDDRDELGRGTIGLGSHDMQVVLTLWGSPSNMTGDLQFTCVSPELLSKARDLSKHLLRPPSKEGGPVFALTKNGDDYDTTRIGTAGSPLERGNYGAKVLEDYDHLVKDLGAKTPCGRLVIFSGEPGTGKTFLVRSLLLNVKDATFLLVPPHLMANLGDPELISVLAGAREGKGPLVILAEDADDCLVPREDGDHVDLENIQAVLNLGDGILGSVLDVRVVITTNAPRMKMDRAAIRPGRLCKHLHVDALSPKEAEAVLDRLLVTREPSMVPVFSDATPLAQVYAKARQMGWVPPEPPSDDAEEEVDSDDSYPG